MKTVMWMRKGPSYPLIIGIGRRLHTTPDRYQMDFCGPYF